MGFYAPSTLIADARQHGVKVRPVNINHSDKDCTIEPDGTIRIGLAHIKGLHATDIDKLLHARKKTGRGQFRSLEHLAAHSGISANTLQTLAHSGACDTLAGTKNPRARRTALWQLGIATPAHTTTQGAQLALNPALPDPPALPALSEWETMITDYQATGVSIDRHPIQLLRDVLDRQSATPIADLTDIPHGAHIHVGGLVIARQKPQTAHGITFLLLEDEHARLNVIVPRHLYEPHKLTIITQPLIIVHGRIEHHPNAGGQINLLAHTIQPLTHQADPTAQIKRLPHNHEANTNPAADHNESQAQHLAATGTTDFHAIAPPAINFGRGRRR